MRNIILIAVFVLGLVSISVAAENESDGEAVYRDYLNFEELVQGGQITPNWILGTSSFWYAEGGPQDRVIYQVDPIENERRPLFDTKRLREALTQEFGFEPAGKGVPFETLQFVGPERVQFSLEGDTWHLDLKDYTLDEQSKPTDWDYTPLVVSEKTRVTPKPFYRESFSGLGKILAYEKPSPDFKWFASTRQNDIALRATVDGQFAMLTDDGTEDLFWDVETAKWQPWSPNSQYLAAFKIDTRKMARIPTIKWLKPLLAAEEVIAVPAGGVLHRSELFILNVNGGLPVQVELGDTTDLYLIVLGWLPDSSEMIFARYNRLLSKIDIMAADPVTGKTRSVMTEQSDTFLTNHHEAIWGSDTGFYLLPDGSGFVWRSERDGWDHLYLYDMEGKLQRRLTSGDFPVIDVTRIDQGGGWVYFQAHGDPERPYDNHLYRVSLKGRDLTQLTEGKGRHTVDISPDARYFTDTYSSVETPPKTVLRATDGTMLRTLGEADISRLQSVGWEPSKEYVVKAADGETDIWVTVNFPYDFDPEKKYPVVEFIYAGPQTTVRQMDLFPGPHHQYNQAIAQLGFITLSLDARGTPGRSKAFHDTVYRKWGQSEISDHAAAIRQLGDRLPFMDIERVGIMGGSWGGEFAFRALAQEPELYKAAISESPGYDSRDSILYEPYLGMPAQNKALYDAANAINLAPQVKGKLLITGGVNDPAGAQHVFKMSESLIRNGIQHEIMIYPNSGHGYYGISRVYNNELKKNWLVEQLKP